MLRGNLEKVTSETIAGWAQDASRPQDPLSLIITNNDKFVGRVVADRYREDVEAHIGNGHHGFEFALSHALSPFERHVIRVFYEVDETDIPGSPLTLEPIEQRNTLRGYLDKVSSRIISGWAQDTFRPDDPVSLIITSDDKLLTRVLANRYRQDVKDAGIGSGRHAFEFVLLNSLSPTERHVLRVCSEADGTDIPGSPVTLEPSFALGDAEQQYVTELLGRLDAADEIASAVGFLTVELDKLKQRQADHQSAFAERAYVRELARQGQLDSTQVTIPRLPPRAIIIDDRTPKIDRDAGSNAILSHIQSLQRLGYEVVFLPSEEFAARDLNDSALDALGVTCCRAPVYGSVEEVLRRQAHTFDVVYLHRVSNASKYLALARNYLPKARIIYSVADLHHIRLARQAQAEDRPELVGWSRRVRLQEYMAAAMADVVITHSLFEAEILRKDVRGADVHVVPWSVPARPTSVPFAERQGLAFIGSFGHPPNLDAAIWLIKEVMPLVRQHDPNISCQLVGSDMPESLAQLCGNGVAAMGQVDKLADVFDRVRLTVAPLAFGAGIKGKVLDSMAAGIPCVCTPIAAEGLDLPELLRACVADNAQALAAIIGRLHSREELNTACQAAGLDYVASHYSADLVDQLISKAIGK